MPTVADIIDALFLRAPQELAHDGDNVGLQVGDPTAAVRRVLVALDATRSVLSLAEKYGAQALVVHHPLLFNPLRSLDIRTHISSLLAQALRSDVSVVSMHTNLDFAPGGVNNRLAHVAGLRNVRPLRPCGQGSLVKLVVFVPKDDQERVRLAMTNAGAGGIGNYSDCSFRTPGIGAFRPQVGAQPAIGTVGVLTEIAEERVEVLIPKAQLGRVLGALLQAHPYEEPAYDICQLANPYPGAGEGTLGELATPCSVTIFARRIARALHATPVRITGDGERTVASVAVLGGSARGYVETARQVGADVLLAGEIPHHERLEAQDAGLAVVELGHGPSELPAVWVLADWLKEAFGADLDVIQEKEAV